MSGPSVPVEPPGPPFTATVELPASLEASAELPASLEATVTVPAPGGPGAGAVSPLTLTANEPTETPLTVNNAIGQSADLLDVNAVGSNYLKVTSVGTFQQQMPAGYSDQITGMLVINPNYDPGGDQRFPGVMVSTYNYGKPGTLGLVIWATATQTADLLRTVSGPTPTVLGGIDAGGRPYYGPTASFGGGTGPMLFLANATTEPTTDPVGGGILYVSDGALKYKGLDGVVDLSAGPGVASPLTLTANEPTETPLTLTGAASQTADALVVTDSAGTTLLKVTASGSLNQPTNSLGNSFQTYPGYATSFASILSVIANYAAGGSVLYPALVVDTYSNTKPSTLGIVIRADAAQTADLLRCVIGATPTTLMGVDAGGRPYVGAAPSFGGGVGPMMFLADATTEPVTDPEGGGVLFVSDGALKYKGSAGTVTTLAPA